MSEARHHFFRKKLDGSLTWWSTCRNPYSVYWLKTEAKKYDIVPFEDKENHYFILDKVSA